MNHKLNVFKFILLISCLETANVLSSPLDKERRTRKIGAQTDSLYIRDVMRLAKAADMRNYMNESVDPCADFYEFACGSWKKINPTTTQSETGYIFQLIEGIQRKKLDLLRSNLSADDEQTEATIEKEVKVFYRSCMHDDTLKPKAYKSDLLKLIAEFGTMPALDPKSWNESQFDWLSTIAKIKKAYGVSIILGSTIMGDIKNNTINRFYIGQPTLQLEVRSMYLDEKNKEYREDYRDAMKSELIEAMDMAEDKALETANELLSFEIELAKGLPDEKADSSQRESFFVTTAEQMHRKYAPEIDIEKYVLLLFGRRITNPIYEIEESYQQNLVQVINATTKETLANYIFYKLLTSFMPEETGKGAKRMKYCEKITEVFFSEILENMVYRHFDTSNTERDINLIFQELKKVFRAKLRSNELNWVSLRTRENALKKLEATNFEITSYMQSNFTEEFGEIHMFESNFFENIKNLYRNQAKNKKAELFKPKPKKQPGLPYTPIFAHTDNTIKVPVALLQPNYFWSPNYPQAIKFGSLGALLGHELIHGFADQGLKYDELGNKRDWWDAKSMEAFQNHTECFKEQYHKYTFGDILLPRLEAQSENIADNGGLRLAYEAYLGWKTEAALNNEDFSLETLPLLKRYTDRKLFFISFGQVWCNEIDSEIIAKKIAMDEHTPAKFRVIGTLSNFKEFSKEFNCNENDRMNPTNKCIIY